MDKLGPVIQWIKKNFFWLGCAFLSVAMIGVWFVASNMLAAETKKRTSNVTKSVSTVKGILNVTPEDIEEGGAHPNTSSEEGMKAELSETIDSIVEAWNLRRVAQEKILVWPSVIPSKQFVDFFSQYNPPETFPEDLQWGTQTEQMLQLYRSKIPEQMVFLCGDDVLRTRWKYDPALADSLQMDNQAGGAGSGGPPGMGGRSGSGGPPGGGRGGPPGFGNGMPGGMGGGMGGMGGMGSTDFADYSKYAVRWSEKNQDLWYQKMTQFQGRDGNQFEYPTPLQCYMLQQDLWLLEAMFRIIRQVNGDSNANDLSVIKTIDHVVFGREVGGKLGELTPPDQRLAGKPPAGMKMGGGKGGPGGPPGGGDPGAGGPPDMGAMMGDMFNRGGPGGPPGGGGTDVVAAGSTVPYDLLYVDVNYEPLPAETVRAVITGTELPEENLELIVAKRVPVRIAVKMDERRIGDFMAACANSPFAFEIQQVRWNRHTPGGDDIVLGGATGGVSGRDKMGGMGQDLGLGAGLGGATSLVTVPTETRTSYDVHVEFYGIVKIYNPVREDELRRAAGLMEDPLNPGDAASVANPQSNDKAKP